MAAAFLFFKTKGGTLVFRFLAAAFWIPTLAYNAQLPPASWEKYVDQAVEFQNARRFAEAEEALAPAMREAERLGADHPAVASVLLHVGRLRTLRHDYTAARLAFNRALNITDKVYGRENLQYGLLLTNIAMTYHQEGQYSSAEPLYRRAISILERTAGPEHDSTAVAEAGMAKLLLAERRNTEAETLFEKVIPVLEDAGEPDESILASVLTNLAEAYRMDGRYAKAEPFYRRALGMVEEKPALRTDEIGLGLGHFPPMLRKMKRKDEARDLDAQIKSILPK